MSTTYLVCLKLGSGGGSGEGEFQTGDMTWILAMRWIPLKVPKAQAVVGKGC